MTAAERWACEHWCRAVNVENPGPCDCRMADIRAIVLERDQLRALGRVVDVEILDRDNRLRIRWPNGRGSVICAPEIIESMVDRENELRARDEATL